jgi:anti-sigma B factor antagonist
MATTKAYTAPRDERLLLEGPMIFARAVELRDAMLGALEQQHSPVQFDLSEVTELDSAGVQLLLSAKSTAAACDKELKLVGQSSAVVQVLELLRLDSHFGGPAFFLFDEDSP